MSENNAEKLRKMAEIADVDVEALSDEDLEDVAGGGCTCGISSSDCSNGGGGTFNQL